MAEFLHSFVKRIKTLRNQSIKLRFMSVKHRYLAFMLLLWIQSSIGQITDPPATEDKSLLIPTTLEEGDSLITRETSSKTIIADPAMSDWKS